VKSLNILYLKRTDSRRCGTINKYPESSLTNENKREMDEKSSTIQIFG